MAGRRGAARHGTGLLGAVTGLSAVCGGERNVADSAARRMTSEHAGTGAERRAGGAWFAGVRPSGADRGGETQRDGGGAP